jgi:hypothetical protein
MDPKTEEGRAIVEKVGFSFSEDTGTLSTECLATCTTVRYIEIFLHVFSL